MRFRKFIKEEKIKTTIYTLDLYAYTVDKDVKANYPKGDKKDHYKLRTEKETKDYIKELLRSGYIEKKIGGV